MDVLSAVMAEQFVADGNGYLREFCLRVLISHNHRVAFRVVFARLNDYVMVNRYLATTTMLQWMDELPIEEIISTLPAIYALERQSRSESQKILERVKNRLQLVENHKAILQGVTNANPKVRRLCWRLCENIFEWNSAEKIQRAIDTKDLVIGQIVLPDVDTLSDAKLLNILAKVRVY
jgi:hypothetical protein